MFQNCVSIIVISCLLVASITVQYVMYKQPLRAESCPLVAKSKIENDSVVDVKHGWPNKQSRTAYLALAAVDSWCRSEGVVYGLANSSLYGALLFGDYLTGSSDIYVALAFKSPPPVAEWFRKAKTLLEIGGQTNNSVELILLEGGHRVPASSVILHWEVVNETDIAPTRPIALGGFVYQAPAQPHAWLLRDGLIAQQTSASQSWTVGKQIPRIIHQVFIGPKEPPETLMQSCRKLHPDWKYMFWGNDNASDSVETLAAYNAQKALNGKADIVRWNVLKKFGGVWIDADTECLRPFDALLQTGAQFFAPMHNLFNNADPKTHQWELVACNVVGSTPDNPITNWIVQRMQDNPRAAGGEPWIQVGPGIVTEALKTVDFFEARSVRTPFWMFVPIHLSEKTVNRATHPYFKHAWATNEWGTTFNRYGKLGVEENACPDLNVEHAATHTLSCPVVDLSPANPALLSSELQSIYNRTWWSWRTPEQLERIMLNSLLKMFFGLVSEKQLQCWLIAGSLMGSLRHQTIIPWDDDTDILCEEAVKTLLLEHEFKLANQGYKLVPFWGGMKISALQFLSPHKHGWTFPFLDLFFAINKGDSLTIPTPHVNGRKQDIPRKLLYPAKTVCFEGLLCPAPQNSSAFLELYYGSTKWRHVCKRGPWNHILEQAQPGQWEISCRDLQPLWPILKTIPWSLE